MANMKRPSTARPYRRKRTICDLPTEILLMIFEQFFKNVCGTSEMFPINLDRSDRQYKMLGACTLRDLVLRVRSSRYKYDVSSGVEQCDSTIINIMRVCKTWRNIVMEMTFMEDVSEWDWYDHLEKFRIFQYIESDVYQRHKRELLNGEEWRKEDELREAAEEADARKMVRAARRRRLRLRDLRNRVLMGA